MTEPGQVSEPQTEKPGFPTGGAETVERFGRPFRHFPVAVSADAMALAWANKEDAPQGAAVLVDHEIGPRGLHGRLWEVAPTDSLACAIVLRPALSVEEADASWLLAGLVAADAAEAAIGTPVSTWWPDAVVATGTREPLAAMRSEIQLGPGKVKSVIVTVRMDLSRMGMGRDQRDSVVEAVLTAFDATAAELDDGAVGVAAAYEKRCAVVGNRVRVRLLPKGETRGLASGIGRTARLELTSPSGMVERLGVDQIRDLTVI